METKTIIFPVTFPLHTNLFLLSIVFDIVKILLPSEDTTPPKINEDEYIKPFSIETDVPIPLGDKLDWFRQTLYAWESWASQIGLGEGISAMNLVQAAKSSGESSIQDIIGSIKHSPKVDELSEAQLFLALAHKFDLHEDQLSRELEQLENAQQRIKSLLKDPIIESKEKPHVNIPLVKEPVNIQQRMKFWTKLFLQYKGDEIPTGIGLECQDIVERAYEIATSKSSKQIFWLPLGLDQNNLEEKKSKVRKYLSELINVCQKEQLNDEVLNISQEILKLWCSFSEDSFESLSDYIGAKLILEYFEGISKKELFKVIAKRQYKPEINSSKGTFCFFLV